MKLHLILITILLEIKLINGTIVQPDMSSKDKQVTSKYLDQLEPTLQEENWLNVSKLYHQLLKLAQDENKMGNTFFEAMFQQFAKKVNNATPKDYFLDAYQLDLPWHNHYEQSRQEHKAMIEKIYKDLLSGNNLDLNNLDSYLKDKKCNDPRPKNDRYAGVVEALVKEFQKTGGSNVQSLEKLVDQLYLQGNLNFDPQYYSTRSELAILKKDPLTALQWLYYGLAKFKDHPVLMNKMASLVGDVSHHDYQGIMERELPKLENVKSPECSNCQWTDGFLKLKSWNEALERVDDIFNECICLKTSQITCPCTEEMVTQMKRAIRVLILSATFRFEEAKSEAFAGFSSSVPSRMLVNANQYREQLSRFLSSNVVRFFETAKTANKTPTLIAIQNGINKLLDNFSNQMRVFRQRQEHAVKKGEEQKLKSEKAKEELKKRLEETERRRKAGELPDIDNVPLPDQYKGLGVGEIVLNKEKGEIAEKVCKDLLQKRLFKEACQHFMTVKWDSWFVVSNSLKSDFVDELKKMPIIEAFLCYGGSERYVNQKYSLMENRKAIIEKLRQGQSNHDFNTINNEFLGSQLSQLIDPRDQCQKASDVANILAEAHFFSEAIQTVKQYCSSELIQAQQADLIGYWAEGLRQSLDKQGFRDALVIIDFVHTHHQQISTSISGKYSLATFISLANEYMEGNGIPSPLPLDQAEPLFPTVKGRLASVRDTEMHTAFKEAGSKYLHFLPLIEYMHEKRRKQPFQKVPSWGEYTELLFRYYRKLGDFFLSKYWFDEAFTMVASTLNHGYLVREGYKLNNEADPLWRSIMLKDPTLDKFLSRFKEYVKLRLSPKELSSSKTGLKTIDNTEKLVKDKIQVIAPESSSLKTENVQSSTQERLKTLEETEKKDEIQVIVPESSSLKTENVQSSTQERIKPLEEPKKKDEIQVIVPEPSSLKTENFQSSTQERKKPLEESEKKVAQTRLEKTKSSDHQNQIQEKIINTNTRYSEEQEPILPKTTSPHLLRTKKFRETPPSSKIPNVPISIEDIVLGLSDRKLVKVAPKRYHTVSVELKVWEKFMEVIKQVFSSHYIDSFDDLIDWNNLDY